ncbi:MAG: SnoaL-like polyketide cyclase [Gaiellales bacterium]|nr:SnoaL-like polyketide cyclase [Gaiellales bacterium]MEA2455755.1 SnoaL-like polyketide cyclase [Thermoleophilaceae bacterium]
MLAFVRRGYELWNQGDLAAVAEMWSDDLEWHNDPSWPGQQVYFGRDAVVRFLMEEVANVIHLDDIDVESIEPVGDELLIRMLARARGDGSNVDIGKVPVFHLARVRDGKVVRVRAFLDEAPALAAAREASSEG